MKTIAIIGAGAAGCFCAIECARRYPDAAVTVYEAGRVPLAKVAVTGGGRCNFTNSFEQVDSLKEVYPRGTQLMKRALRTFDHEDVMRWFADEGVPCVIQDDCCVFPRSQDAMQIVRTLERLMRELGVKVECGRRLTRITEDLRLEFREGPSVKADRVVLTAGGTSAAVLRQMLPACIEVEDTVPSLFTFKIPDEGIHSLMGAVVEDAVLSLAGTPWRSSGALLLTDWGVSGPVTLKLSSYAARYLAERQYKAELLVNWTGLKEGEVRGWLSEAASSNQQKKVSSVHPDGLTDRLWKHICQRAGLREDIRWAELGSKGANRLVSVLTADCYPVDGRAKFKEEFVTCGGVSLQSVNPATLESKNLPGLFFAGEVLDIDAVTGGFNLQAAWTTGYICAVSLMSREEAPTLKV